MGRFKIYDPEKLVNILNDSNYAKCLLCEKKLKNIMGNIKRHYEQMHSVNVNANIHKTKNFRKKSKKFRTDDKDYKLPNATKKSIDNNNQNCLPINEMDKTKTTATTSTISNNYFPSAPAVFQLSTYSKQTCPQENTIDCNQSISLFKQEHPINSFAELPALQENKLNEKSEMYLKTDKKQQAPSHYSHLKKIKLDEENEGFDIPCYSYISNIQIASVDSCHTLEFLKCSVETKTHINIPLTTFQKADTFQKALQAWEPNFKFNYSSEKIGEHIDRMTKNLRHEIIKIAANRIIYLKLDIASNTEDNVMFVNIQFIKDFKIKVITLSALQLSDDDMATYLKKKVLTTLERYKIDIGRVYSIIKDNTNNFRESPKFNDNSPHESMNDSHIFPQSVDYCQHLCHNFTGHAIHFAASDIIKQLNENISQCRDSAKSLRRQLSRANIKQLPLLDNTFSWLSVYDMIESLLKIRETVENNNLLVAEVDWLFVIKFVTGFRPIVETALMLQSSDLLITGDFFREWLLCEVKLEELTDTNEIALYLLEAVEKQKTDFFKSSSFLAALYLDPRFCYMGSIYLSDKQKEVAITQLLQIFNKLQTINEYTTSHTSINHSDINLNDPYSKLEKRTATSLKTNMDTMISYDAICWSNVDLHCVKESLEQLQFEVRLPLKTNILEYWNMVKYKMPILAKIAEIALAAPATQATINRALNNSSTNLIRRKRFESSDNTENLLLLKLNQDLVDKISLV